ncbi:hypothetical protein ACFUCH_35515 [Streptomyces olivaceus]|uniref:hypothetical protein n=1 Tax=Streptomyces olivaceus TaxID=47716 RepID=UPI00362A643D
MNEYAVLGAMADKADPDGCGTWLSKETISARVHVSEETVKRCWRNMSKRGLIAKGDQALVRHYRADRRPTVYDLLIPYKWFSNVDRVNAERERLGRPPLTPADRPPIPAAPAKKIRADKGKPRPKKNTTADQASKQRGNSETPRDPAPEGTHGGTTSSPRGNYESPAGALQDPQHSESTQSQDTGNDGGSVRPSVQVEDAYAQGTEGRTADDAQGGEEGTPGAAGPDAAQAGAAPNSGSNGGAVPGGAGVPSAGGSETTPGMEVLIRVGRANTMLQIPPGPALWDQSQRINELIANSEALGEPWMLSDLVTVLSAPLNEPIRKSAGAVVAKRIKLLPPTPRTSMVPSQGRGGAGDDTAPYAGMSAGAERTVEEAVKVPAGQRKNCSGQDGLCDRLALPGEDLCARCRDGREPVCPEYGCTNRVLVPGALCAGCQSGDGAEAGPPLTACPGYDGTPCGRMPQAGGMCLRCRTAAEQARAALDEDWVVKVAAVTGMSDDERADVEAGAGPPPF